MEFSNKDLLTICEGRDVQNAEEKEAPPDYYYFKENHSDRNYSLMKSNNENWETMKQKGYGRIFDYGRFQWEEKNLHKKIS